MDHPPSQAIPKQVIQSNRHLSKHSVVKPYLDKLVAGSARGKSEGFQTRDDPPSQANNSI
ncbi:hypothetical protein AB6G20_12340 [Providencia hangzhouensis]|uniref:hypothetical protein n=1 Tax=Providencia hangzhouensis TaxID=3031799 RepID=UPI0034DD3A4D